MRRLKQERGFTIVEVMAAVVVLLVGALGTLAMLDTASKRSRTAADRQKGTSLAREVLERAKSLNYAQVEPGSIVARLREDAAIAGTSASPWQITRDGTTFTVQAQVCHLDEPADGLGAHTSSFCSDAAAGGTTDPNPVDYKRITITTSWKNGAGAGSSRQSALVTGRAGGDDAPAVEAPRLTSPASSPITSAATMSASFAVTTAADAASVSWSIDGVQQGPATGSGKNWTFSWPLPPYDGTYDISAQAFGPTGAASEPRSTTVVVNRFAPIAPTGMNAGRNGSIVEAEWTANKERDIIGYRVYRSAGGGPAALACALTTETWCVDTSPPIALGQSLTYWAVAVDRDPANAERDGASSAKIEVNINNRPPNAPTGLTVAKDGNGNTLLNWVAPSTPDPDAGDGIHSYRIYRDGTAVADRINRVDGSETFVLDPRTGGAIHQYWVTAVDTHMHESSFLGPVSG